MPMDPTVTVGAGLTVFDLAARLVLAVFFGALVGIERRWHHKHAGIQTHALVSLGAASFGLLSLIGFGPTNNPMLIAGGVVTGIGFIGGGVIMRRGSNVQGVNTAASLWATAALGLALGPGHYALGALILVATLFVQFPLRWLEHGIKRRFPGTRPGLSTYRLLVRSSADAADAGVVVWAEFARRTSVTVKTIDARRDGGSVVRRVEFGLLDAYEHELLHLNGALANTAGIEHIRVERVPLIDRE